MPASPSGYQYWPRLLTPYGSTKPQWINALVSGSRHFRRKQPQWHSHALKWLFGLADIQFKHAILNKSLLLQVIVLCLLRQAITNIGQDYWHHMARLSHNELMPSFLEAISLQYVMYHFIMWLIIVKFIFMGNQNYYPYLHYSCWKFLEI